MSDKFAEKNTSNTLRIMAEAKRFPETNALLSYLAQRKAVPDKESRGTLSGGYGEFQFANRPGEVEFAVGPAGKIRLQRNATTGTVIHELTHAADMQIDRQYYEDSNNQKGPGNQFTDAYNKMRFKPTSNPKERYPFDRLVSSLAPGFMKKEADYRGTVREIRAFAMGDSAAPGATTNTDGIPPHLNATVATEFMILLDLAARSETKKAKPTPK